MEPQGFEPRSRPYEWNELAAVSYPCQDHFLRVLPLHQGSEKIGGTPLSCYKNFKLFSASLNDKLRQYNRNILRVVFGVYILTECIEFPTSSK